jgi:uncharacterized membrane protein YdbT with pleckstrin-like domain
MVTWQPPDEMRAGRRAMHSASVEMGRTGQAVSPSTFLGQNRIFPVHGRTAAATNIVDCEDAYDEAQPLTGRRRPSPATLSLRRLITYQLAGVCLLIIFAVLVFVGLGLVVLQVNQGVASITKEMQPGITRMRDSSLVLLNSTTALMDSSSLVAKSAHSSGMVNSSAEVAKLVAKLLRKPSITINLGS